MSQIKKRDIYKSAGNDIEIKRDQDKLLVLGDVTVESGISFIPRHKYEMRMQDGETEFYKDLKIIDFNNDRSYMFDSVGNISDSNRITDKEMSYHVHLSSNSIKEFKHEFFAIRDKTIYNKNGEKEIRTILGNPNTKYISLNSALTLIRSPAKFHKDGDIWITDDESQMDKLLKIAIINPGQFDELFTIDVDTPESPLMRNYLRILSELVLEEMSKIEDSSIDNIEDLEKIAYERAGYQGKILETVKQEAKDYHRHFRYLLTKGEKTSVTEQQAEYFSDIITLYSKGRMSFEYLKVKNNNLDYEINECLSISKIFNFKEKIPCLYISKDKLISTYFLYVENMYNIEKEIEKTIIPLKVSVHNEILCKVFKDKCVGEPKVDNRVVISDKNLNLVLFEIKQSTLLKWKKNLKDELIHLDTVCSDKSNIPIEFSNPYL